MPDPNSSPHHESHPGSVAVVGCGRLGGALIRALGFYGIPVSVYRPTVTTDTTALDDLLRRVDTVVLTVPDDAIAEMAHTCGKARSERPIRWVHMSGVRDATVLDAARGAGEIAAAIHPLQTFGPDADQETFLGVVAAIDVEGPNGTSFARGFAELLGMRPVPVPAAVRPLYHAGGAFASGFLSLLLATARDLLSAAGLSDDVIRTGLAVIVDTTVHEALAHPERKPTGPIVRGDLATVRTHLGALRAFDPAAENLYRALGVAMERRLPPHHPLRTQVRDSLLDHS